jgi:hypothetical protein
MSPIRLGLATAAAVCAIAGLAADTRAEDKKVKWPAQIQAVLDNTSVLKHSRGKRLPIYLWPAMNPGKLDPATAEELVRELDRRGVGLVCGWDNGHREASLEAALPIARAQKKLGLRINIEASSCIYSFFDGDERTAHIDADGKPFWDTSFGPPTMGCPFAIDHRRAALRERFEYFAEAYKREALSPGFVFTDWEVDGPIEWNAAWAASKRCKRCREHIPDIDTNFLAFQKALRDLRGDLQRDVYADPLLARFPDVLVGNYAVYPDDGWRYWFDYFEKQDVDGLPVLTDQHVHYRHSAGSSEFQRSGYTFAMPVAYTWAWIYKSYDFESSDYRWFYNMLLEASSAGRSAPASLPVITFVHWHTTAPTDPNDKSIKQMSAESYQELLWHMLLRHSSTFYLWCPAEESVEEMKLVYPVWAAAQEYGEFLDRGTPICFDVPSQPGTVVSGLLLGNRVLVRRTDFAGATGTVELRVRDKVLKVPAAPGRCQILRLD